jgi:hypothetical protein
MSPHDRTAGLALPNQVGGRTILFNRFRPPAIVEGVSDVAKTKLKAQAPQQSTASFGRRWTIVVTGLAAREAIGVGVTDAGYGARIRSELSAVYWDGFSPSAS